MDSQVDIPFDKIIKRTPHAILFQVGDDEVWLPKSQIVVDTGEKTVAMPEWLAVHSEIESYAL